MAEEFVVWHPIDTLNQHRQLFQQTQTLLDLYGQGAITDPKIARTYLGDETMGFLRSAVKGAEAVYERAYHAEQPGELLIREAADVAYVVFAWMHEMMTSPYLPKGFSRRGMLQAPQTPEDFKQRIQEIQRHIGLLVNGLGNNAISSRTMMESLRARSFFRTGSMLPFNFPNSHMRDEINQLLKGVDL